MSGAGKAVEPDLRARRRWAVVRIALGTAQIMTATFAAVVLLSGRNEALAVGAGVVAACLVVASRALFRGDRTGE